MTETITFPSGTNPKVVKKLEESDVVTKVDVLREGIMFNVFRITIKTE